MERGRLQNQGLRVQIPVGTIISHILFLSPFFSFFTLEVESIEISNGNHRNSPQNTLFQQIDCKALITQFWADNHEHTNMPC